MKCPLYSCHKCENHQKCLTCKNGYYHDNAKLCCADPNCFKCSPLGEKCEVCDSGFYLLNHKCLTADQCATNIGKFANDANKLCDDCDNTCKTCVTTLNHCTSCKSEQNRYL